MSSTILDIKLDSNDSKYHQLRKAFLDELRNNFFVEDYDPIIKYLKLYKFIDMFSLTFSKRKGQKKKL